MWVHVTRIYILATENLGSRDLVHWIKMDGKLENWIGIMQCMIGCMLTNNLNKSNVLALLNY